MSCDDKHGHDTCIRPFTLSRMHIRTCTLAVCACHAVANIGLCTCMHPTPTYKHTRIHVHAGDCPALAKTDLYSCIHPSIYLTYIDVHVLQACIPPWHTHTHTYIYMCCRRLSRGGKNRLSDNDQLRRSKRQRIEVVGFEQQCSPVYQAARAAAMAAAREVRKLEQSYLCVCMPHVLAYYAALAAQEQWRERWVKTSSGLQLLSCG
jgi:hypothetical protein